MKEIDLVIEKINVNNEIIEKLLQIAKEKNEVSENAKKRKKKK